MYQVMRMVNNNWIPVRTLPERQRTTNPYKPGTLITFNTLTRSGVVRILPTVTQRAYCLRDLLEAGETRAIVLKRAGKYSLAIDTSESPVIITKEGEPVNYSERTYDLSSVKHMLFDEDGNKYTSDSNDSIYGEIPESIIEEYKALRRNHTPLFFISSDRRY